MKLFITLLLFAGIAQGQINNNPSYLTKAIAASTYVPYTGATKVLNLGAYGITASSFTGSGAALTAITAANISGGSLGTNVIASSVAVGSVYNGATTAASANTASAIVARDASGNFTAGTITGSLVGAASLNVLKAGDTMTGDLTVPGLAVTTITFPMGGAFNYQRNVLNNNLTVTSSVTFSANAFSVGGSTFVVSAGNVGLGLTPSTNAGEYLQTSGDSALKVNTTLPLFMRGGSGAQIVVNRSPLTGTFVNSGLSASSIEFLSETSNGYLRFNTSNANNTNPTEKMRITSAGNVGIGTTTPVAQLAVVQPAASSNYMMWVGSSTQSGGGSFNVTAAGNVFAQKLGINNLSPSATLDVTGSGTFTQGVLVGAAGSGNLDINSSALRFLAGGGAERATLSLTGLYGLKINVAGNDYVAVSTLGNVGIGTASPATKLHISSGTITVDGNVTPSLITSAGVKIGTTSIAAGFFHVQTPAGTDSQTAYALKISSGDGSSVFGVHPNGHLSIYGALSSVVNCTNGAIVAGGRDGAGKIAFTGANATCDVVFGSPFDAAAVCVCSGLASASEGCLIKAESATGFTFTPLTPGGAGDYGNGDGVNYICVGAH